MAKLQRNLNYFRRNFWPYLLYVDMLCTCICSGLRSCFGPTGLASSEVAPPTGARDTRERPLQSGTSSTGCWRNRQTDRLTDMRQSTQDTGPQHTLQFNRGLPPYRLVHLVQLPYRLAHPVHPSTQTSSPTHPPTQLAGSEGMLSPP